MVVVRNWGTEDTWTLQKSLQLSAPVVFYYLLVTNSPVTAGTRATQWLMLKPGDILGNNQYKMPWVGATIRVINLDSLLFDKANNA